MRFILKYFSGGVLLAVASVAFASPVSGTMTTESGNVSIEPSLLESGGYAPDDPIILAALPSADATGQAILVTDMTRLTADRAASESGVRFAAAVPTPEPTALMLLGTGLIGAAGMVFHRRRLAD